MRPRFFFFLVPWLFGVSARAAVDEHLWLENSKDAGVRDWTEDQSGYTEIRLKGDWRFSKVRDYFLSRMSDPEALAVGTIHGSHVYHVRKDSRHLHGVLRTSRLDNYRMGVPSWETVLDLDELSKLEQTSWYLHDIVYPRDPDSTRVLIKLTRDGRDAVVVREFDFATRDFVPGGFEIREGRTRVGWFDRDRIFVAANEGPESVDLAGYPLNVRILTRGQALHEAPIVHEATADHAPTGGYMINRPGDGRRPIPIVWEYDQAIEGRRYWTLDVTHPENLELKRPIDFPPGMRLEGFYRGDYIGRLKRAWPEKGFPAGSLVAIDADTGVASEIYKSQDGKIVEGVHASQNYLYVSLLNRARRQLDRLQKTKRGYVHAPLQFPLDREVSVLEGSGATKFLQFSSTDYLQPWSLHVQGESAELVPAAYRAKSSFDESKFEVHQRWAPSQDGTMIPYFLIHAKGRKPDQTLPVRISVYGGFGRSMTPSYLGSIGKLWLEQGGAYVEANVRGGGEFGPEWHDAVKLTNRHKAFEDLVGVAEHLVQTGVAAAGNIGIEGASYGGLLVTAASLMRPGLFGATVADAPLTDMLRSHVLGVGGSWVNEFGNPDRDANIRDYWLRHSPLHNVPKGTTLPEMFITASRSDDRVPAAHARKFAAALMEKGHGVLFHESSDGGHVGASDVKQAAVRAAMTCVYLYQKLID